MNIFGVPLPHIIIIAILIIANIPLYFKLGIFFWGDKESFYNALKESSKHHGKYNADGRRVWLPGEDLITNMGVYCLCCLFITVIELIIFMAIIN